MGAEFHRRVVWIVANERLAEQCHVPDAAAISPDRVQWRRERKQSVARDQPVARLEPHDPAKGRRPNQRAIGLGADREWHHPIGHRRRRAARGPPGRAAGIQRVPGLARVEEGKLGGHGLTHDHRARFPQAADDGRVTRRLAPRIQPRTVLGRHRAGIDDVLQAHGKSVQRADWTARPA